MNVKVKQDRFITKNQLYDDIIQSETADIRLKAIPEELEMFEFNINEKIELMKRQIEWSNQTIEPLEPAVKEINETVGDLHEELRQLTNVTKKNQNIIDRGVLEELDRLQAVKNKISQQELLLEEASELLQSTTDEEIGFIDSHQPCSDEFIDRK